MPAVTAADLAEHLNLPAEVEGADWSILERLVSAAQTFTESYLGYSFDERFEDDPVPAPLRVAVLMLASHWYEAREAATPEKMTAIPFGFDEIISAYRDWTF